MSIVSKKLSAYTKWQNFGWDEIFRTPLRKAGREECRRGSVSSDVQNCTKRSHPFASLKGSGCTLQAREAGRTLSRAAVLLSIGKLASLILLVLVDIPSVARSRILRVHMPEADRLTEAALLLLFAYAGFENSPAAAGEYPPLPPFASASFRARREETSSQAPSRPPPGWSCTDSGVSSRFKVQSSKFATGSTVTPNIKP